MGYVAWGSGTVILDGKKVKDIDAVIDAINEEFDEIHIESSDKSGHIEIVVSHSEKFDPEGAFDVLKEIGRYTVEGEIKMEGEDGSRWRYRFEKEYRGWVEENCHSIFDRYVKENDSYEIPAFVLIKTGFQTKYAGPEKGMKIRNVAEVAEVFIDQARAELECRKRNAENRETGVSYSVMKTCIIE